MEWVLTALLLLWIRLSPSRLRWLLLLIRLLACYLSQLEAAATLSELAEGALDTLPTGGRGTPPSVGYPPSMTDDAEQITVLSLEAGRALVRLPDGSEENWSVASLPPEVQPGDVVAVQVINGDMECWIVPRSVGLKA